VSAGDTGEGMGIVNLWDLTMGRLRMCLRTLGGGFKAVAVTADGKTLVWARARSRADRGLYLYDLEARRDARSFVALAQQGGGIAHGAFALVGEQLLVAEKDTARVRRWGVAGGEEKAIPLQGSLGSVSALSTAGRNLASTDNAGPPARYSPTVVLWD